MADFQNGLISRIFGVFSSDFFHRITLMFLLNGFSRVFGIFNFSPKLIILQRLYSLCMGYCLCKMADFQNGLIYRIFGVFSSAFLHRINLIFL